MTLLERPGLAMPDDDGENEADVPRRRAMAAQEAAFAGLVADYARRLDRGEAPDAGLHGGTGWGRLGAVR